MRKRRSASAGSRPRGGDLPLHVGPEKVQAPAKALLVPQGQEALGKAPPEPQDGLGLPAYLQEVKGGEFHVARPPRQALPRLAAHLGGEGAQEEVKAASQAPPAGAVHEATEEGEKPGHAVDLVQDHQAAQVGLQVELGGGELGPVGLRLQV